MHYVCIENNSIVSILNYRPNVPGSVSVVEISDEQESQLKNQTHYFDLNSKSVTPISGTVSAQKAQDLANAQEREFLNSTDWKILRHIREKALGIATSLTESQYLELEQQRAAAAARIV